MKEKNKWFDENSTNALEERHELWNRFWKHWSTQAYEWCKRTHDEYIKI